MSPLTNSIRSAIGKTTQQAVFGLLIVVTLCYLAISGAIDGPSFLGVGMLVVGALFGRNLPTGDKGE